MKRKQVDYNVLTIMVRDIFLSYGYSLEESVIIADIIVDAELCGKVTHGIQRLKLYHQKIKNNKIDVYAKSTVLNETKSSISFDAHNRIGQLAAYEAMQAAIDKSNVNGIGIANVFNSNNFGAAGYYVKMASKINRIGICMSNTPAFCVPTNGNMSVLGTNPVAVSIPSLGDPFCMDISTSITSVGTIELYKMENRKLPKGWVVDEFGKDIIDPSDALDKLWEHKGGMLTLGGKDVLYGSYKGYALSLVVELLTSTLINQRIEMTKNGIAHFFCVIDCSIFGDVRIIKENVSTILERMKTAGTSDSIEKVIIPGERAFNTERNFKKEGIYISDMMYDEMANIMKDCNLDIDEYLQGM